MGDLTWLTALGPSGLAALGVGLMLLILLGLLRRFVVDLMTGKLVPRQQLLDERAEKEKWHKAHDVIAAGLDRQTEVTQQLVEALDRPSWAATDRGRHRRAG